MPISLYLHIPFCQRKCPYCDFNTYAGLQGLYEPLAAALVQEIEAAGAARDRPAVSTVFLGGGTPTVLPAALLHRLLEACRDAFHVLPGAEITSEANPGTVDVSRFAALRAMGINRLSMGVQSFDDEELAFLGRIHSADQARAAFQAARAAGFDNVNLDVMFGLPEQSPATWRNTLRQALALGPEHLSLYSLTIEEDTPYADWAAAGRIGTPDPDLAADLYELADELLDSAGYVQYEISNWARDGGQRAKGSGQSSVTGEQSAEEPLSTVSQPTTLTTSLSTSYRSPKPANLPPYYTCQHNLTYWRNQAYLGFGPGAHSSEDGRRWANIQPVAAYVEGIKTGRPVMEFVEEIDTRLAMGETMMLGLRLVREGVAFRRFREQHGRELLDVFGQEVADLERMGLLARLPDRVRLTPGGRLLGNQVFARFLP